MYVSWKKKGAGFYAYLRESFWDRELKAPRARVTYLGNNLEMARQKLLSILKSGQLAIPALEQKALFEQLEKQAPATSRPKVDRTLEATKKVLQARVNIHQGSRPEVSEILRKALEAINKLEGEQ